MHCYRLIRKIYDPLSAKGAVLNGGRFNSPGRPLLYLAKSEAVAVLESRVHSRRLNNIKRILHIIEIPDEMVSRPEDLKMYLPSDYNLVPPPISCQEFGDAWLDSQASLGLIVPSIPGGPDGNVLVNPQHPLFLKNVKPIGGRPFEFDRRLYRRKPGEK